MPTFSVFMLMTVMDYKLNLNLEMTVVWLGYQNLHLSFELFSYNKAKYPHLQQNEWAEFTQMAVHVPWLPNSTK